MSLRQLTNTYLPSQFPLAAVDGAVSTKWQPTYSNITAYLTVELTSQSFQPIMGFSFDWAQHPPAYYAVEFSNSSIIHPGSGVNVTSSNDTAISTPYNAARVADITPYVSNGTNVTLARPVWSGRHATLIIEDNKANQFNNGSGATVAEWAIIGANGQTMPVRYRPRRNAP